MMRTDIDMRKLDRFRLDLTQGQSAIRALTGEYAESRDHHSWLRSQIARDCWRGLGSEWTERQPVSELLALDPEFLKSARVDIAMAREAVAEWERMAEIHRRIEVLRADLAPLAPLDPRRRSACSPAPYGNC